MIEQVIPNSKFVSQTPGNCLDACEEIVKKSGYTHDRNDVLIMICNVDGDDFDYHRDCLKKGIELIDQHLEAGMPIIVGVDYKSGSANFDKITDHWIVIIARGVDENGVFYRYFEVGQEKDDGILVTNKIYLKENGLLKGNCTCNHKYSDYWVTMVRPCTNDYCKCCGRAIFEGWSQLEKRKKQCLVTDGFYNNQREKTQNKLSRQ